MGTPLRDLLFGSEGRLWVKSGAEQGMVVRASIGRRAWHAETNLTRRVSVPQFKTLNRNPKTQNLSPKA